MAEFILNRGTTVNYDGLYSKSVAHFIRIFERDMAWTLAETGKTIKNHIVLTLETKNEDLVAEQYIFTVNDGTIQLRAQDERGLIYGLLYMSETYLGMDRLWFWNNMMLKQKEAITIECGTRVSGIPEVRYRGWFVNDEVLLAQWSHGASPEEKWERIFETLLRCKGNMVIPGTDLADPLPQKVASDMGLMISHHHSEPLGAEMFSRVYPDHNPSYVENKNLFTALWRDAIIKQKNQQVIWNIGFRGQGDRPFWADDPSFDTDEKRGALISEIIKDQYDLISEYQENPACCVNLYGEVTELYQKGYLQIPEQVIKVWADSGYGKMVSRRQNNDNPRFISQPSERMGGLHGIYYHVTFYDLQASNHLTMFPNTPDFMQKELSNSFKKNMNEYVIVNVGNIRPHLFYVDLMSRIWEEGDVELASFEEAYFKNNFENHSLKVQAAFERYQEAIIPYGTHPDERAGEQLYFYAIRYLAHAWLTGQTKGTPRLNWLTGEEELAQQVQYVAELIQPKLSQWKTLEETVAVMMSDDEVVGSRVFDQLYLPVSIHHHGIEALKHVCNGFKEWEQQDILAAFLELSQAHEHLVLLLGKMEIATNPKWEGFYANDCLTNVSLAAEILDTLRKYLRLIGDGPNYYTWEKEYLTDKSESAVMLLTNKTKQLSNDDLYRRLMRINNIT